MDIKEMKFGELVEIVTMFSGNNNKTTAKNPAIGKYCIVRCRNAGVHAGMVEDANAEFAVIRNARRLWQWKTKFTLSEAAKYGIIADGSKIATEIDLLIIPMVDIAEFLPCTEKAKKTITEAVEYNV